MEKSTLKNCCIQFDNRPDAVYYSGELVSGTVNINQQKPKKYKEITLRLLGTATASWSESHNKNTIYYKGEQLYFKVYTNLLEQHTNDVNAPGEQKYAFSFLLPPNLPSSYKGPWGGIKYEVKVTVKTSSHGESCHRAQIQVLANINLNVMPNIRSPAVMQKSQDLYLFFSKRGNVQITFETQYQGFVPGQEILLKCQVKNASKVKILKIKFSLRQVIIFKATSPYSNKKKLHSKIASDFGEGIDKHQDKDILATLIVPAIPTSTLDLCYVINISYFIKAEIVLDGTYFNLICQIPIIIGTVLLQEHGQLNSGPFYPDHLANSTPLAPLDQTPIAGPSTSSGAWMQQPPDLPTYEDVLREDFGINEKAKQHAALAPNMNGETSSLSSNASGDVYERRPSVSSECDSLDEACEKDLSIVDKFNRKTEEKS